MKLFERRIDNMGPLALEADKAFGYYTFPKLTGEIGPRMKFMGDEKIVWSINSYLGLANHPEVRKADAEIAAKWGFSYPMGSRIMSGHTDQHEQLERELAAAVNKKAAYVLNFGYQGIMSVIDAMLDRHDVLVYDAEGHACIVDGARLHAGKRFAYRFNDMDSFAKNLERASKITAKTGGGILVVTEGVFGMRGVQGKLTEMIALKEKYPYTLLIDDAHGFGAMGPTGGGTDELQGCQDGVDLYFSTFAKSMAGIGAFIASNEPQIIEFLRYNARSQAFAKSLPMAYVEGTLKRLDMMRKMPELREKLWENVNKLQGGLMERGLNIGTCNTPVTPVYLKASPVEAANLIGDLRQNHKIFCSLVMYPVIPKGMLLLRLIPTAAHTDAEIYPTLDALEDVAGKLKKGTYNTSLVTTA